VGKSKKRGKAPEFLELKKKGALEFVVVAGKTRSKQMEKRRDFNVDSNKKKKNRKEENKPPGEVVKKPGLSLEFRRGRRKHANDTIRGEMT